MPIYTYRCENCGVRVERRQGFNDPPLKICPECRKKSLRKVIGPTRVIFKGSGFYATDHNSASGSRGPKSEKKEDGKPKEESKPKGEVKPVAASSSEASE